MINIEKVFNYRRFNQKLRLSVIARIVINTDDSSSVAGQVKSCFFTIESMANLLLLKLNLKYPLLLLAISVSPCGH